MLNIRSVCARNNFHVTSVRHCFFCGKRTCNFSFSNFTLAIVCSFVKNIKLNFNTMISCAKNKVREEPLLPLTELQLYLERCEAAGIEKAGLSNLRLLFHTTFVEEGTKCLHITGIGHCIDNVSAYHHVRLLLDRSERHLLKTMCNCGGPFDECVHVLALMFEVHTWKLESSYDPLSPHIEDKLLDLATTIREDTPKLLKDFEELCVVEPRQLSGLITCDGRNCPNVPDGGCVLNPMMVSTHMAKFPKNYARSAKGFTDCRLLGLDTADSDDLVPVHAAPLSSVIEELPLTVSIPSNDAVHDTVSPQQLPADSAAKQFQKLSTFLAIPNIVVTNSTRDDPREKHEPIPMLIIPNYSGPLDDSASPDCGQPSEDPVTLVAIAKELLPCDIPLSNGTAMDASTYYGIPHYPATVDAIVLPEEFDSSDDTVTLIITGNDSALATPLPDCATISAAETTSSPVAGDDQEQDYLDITTDDSDVEMTFENSVWHEFDKATASLDANKVYIDELLSNNNFDDFCDAAAMMSSNSIEIDLMEMLSNSNVRDFDRTLTSIENTDSKRFNNMARVPHNTNKGCSYKGDKRRDLSAPFSSAKKQRPN